MPQHPFHREMGFAGICGAKNGGERWSSITIHAANIHEGRGREQAIFFPARGRVVKNCVNQRQFIVKMRVIVATAATDRFG